MMRMFRWVPILPIAFSAALPLMAQAVSGQKTFASPTEAVLALVAAVRTGDQEQLLAVLGTGSKELISSGDPVADKQSRQKFLNMYSAKHSLVTDAPGYKTLVAGISDWPLPIPLVRDGTVWYFDSARGSEEIINRRIGKNELGAIAVCEGYVRAQKEYAAKRHDGESAGIYAQKISSDPGKQNGLYWPVAVGQPQSPLGPEVASAEAEGYSGSAGEPYHGYMYKLLRAQGPDAPGGAKSYLENGKLSAGFAIVAYPANYGVSGIMTFVVNQDDVIYQKDLGDNTASIASKLTTYNPDSTWNTIE